MRAPGRHWSDPERTASAASIRSRYHRPDRDRPLAPAGSHRGPTRSGTSDSQDQRRSGGLDRGPTARRRTRRPRAPATDDSTGTSATPATATTPPKAKATKEKAKTPSRGTAGTPKRTTPNTAPARKKSTGSPKPGTTVKPRPAPPARSSRTRSPRSASATSTVHPARTVSTVVAWSRRATPGSASSCRTRAERSPAAQACPGRPMEAGRRDLHTRSRGHLPGQQQDGRGDEAQHGRTDRHRPGWNRVPVPVGPDAVPVARNHRPAHAAEAGSPTGKTDQHVVPGAVLLRAPPVVGGRIAVG